MPQSEEDGLERKPIYGSVEEKRLRLYKIYIYYNGKEKDDGQGLGYLLVLVILCNTLVIALVVFNGFM